MNAPIAPASCDFAFWADAAAAPGHPLHAWRRELRFSAIHQAHPVGGLEREAACISCHIANWAAPIQAGDFYAGRLDHPSIGLASESVSVGYYCHFPNLERAILAAGSEARPVLEALKAYWDLHDLVQQVRRRYSDAQRQTYPDNAQYSWGPGGGGLQGLPEAFIDAFVTTWRRPDGSADTPAPQVGFPLYRIAGTVPDYARALSLGLPGMRAEVEARRRQGGVDRFCAAILAQLDAVDALIGRYQAEALALGDATLAQVLGNVRVLPPSTLREAIQLFWLLLQATGTLNHGRMDVWAGPFLQRDLDAGLISEEQAVEQLLGAWRLMLALKNSANNRIICLGEGDHDRRASHTFTRLAIEATRRHHAKAPALTLRLTDDTPQDLIDAALACLAEGNTFPIFLNDRVNVDAYATAAAIPRELAREYFPLGCGEYTLPYRSMNTPNGTINMAMVLLAAMNHGCDPASGRRVGPDLGGLDGCATFADFWHVFTANVTFHVERLAEAQALIYQVVGADLAFPLTSYFYHGCLERGLGLIQGGIDHLGGTLEGYGDMGCADGLTALDQVFFRERACDATTLIDALRRDFAGADALRQRMLAAPKFGNDDDVADAMAARVHDLLCDTTRAQARRVGLSSYLIVCINNGYHYYFGRNTSATPDGRRHGQALSNGNGPMAGADHCGLTAVLSSMAKLRADHHAGAVHNVSVTPRLLTRERARFWPLVETYFALGGTQIMLTPVDPGQLEDAIAHPERHPNLLVRVGGYSARFVELCPELQRDIATRTLHGA